MSRPVPVPGTISAEQTLNQIVLQCPEALPVLQHFGLDTCCGGALPLCVAADQHALAVGEVLTALQEVRRRG